MEIRQFRTFDAVARKRSISLAAKDLHYAQSTVSDQILALERELGVVLLDRSRRRLRLTEEGEVFARYVERILTLVGEARFAVTRPVDGLSVGALETVGRHLLPPVLSRFRSLHPAAPVRMVQGNRGTLYDAVRRGELDLSVTFGPPPPDGALSAETLSAEPLVVIAPPGHPLAEQGAVEAAALASEPFLVTEKGCGFREMFDVALGPIVGREPLTEVASLGTLTACVAAGMGCALLPLVSVRNQAELGQVAIVDVTDAVLRTPVTMTWLGRNAANPNLLSFQEMLRGQLAA